MTHRQYSDHIKLCLYLGKEPGGEFKEFYDFLTELWDGMEITPIDDHNEEGNGHTIILHKGKDFYMEHDFINGCLDCHWDRIWSFFRFKKGLEVPETQDFIQSMVEEHLKCKVITPLAMTHQGSVWVEEHLKCKVITPIMFRFVRHRSVEEHLKCKVNNTGQSHAAWKTAVVEEHLKCKVDTTLNTTLNTTLLKPGLIV